MKIADYRIFFLAKRIPIPKLLCELLERFSSPFELLFHCKRVTQCLYIIVLHVDAFISKWYIPSRSIIDSNKILFLRQDTQVKKYISSILHSRRNVANFQRFTRNIHLMIQGSYT